MKRITKTDLVFGLYLIGITIGYFIGIKDVPFHPDESTQIYMSSDVQLFFRSPDNLFWKQEAADQLRQHYRELDAPLSRTIIGIGRAFFNLSELKNDWVWGKSWEENAQNGALPSGRLLLSSRYFVAAFFPFSLLLIYLIGISIRNRALGWLSAVLLSLHPLILLHTRRAMAESLLIFSLLLVLYMLLRCPKHIWLLSIPIAIAFNTKQTTLGLVAAGMVVIYFEMREEGIKRIMKESMCYLLGLALITFLLNPFLWQHPFQAGIAAVKNRQELTTAQIKTYSEINEKYVLNNFQYKTTAFAANTLTTIPQFAESGNYIDQIADSTEGYLASPINSLLINRAVPILLAVLGGCGFALTIIFVGEDRNKYHGHTILLICFLSISISLFILLSLPFQRYYLANIPFLCIFTAESVIAGGAFLQQKIKAFIAKREI